MDIHSDDKPRTFSDIHLKPFREKQQDTKAAEERIQQLLKELKSEGFETGPLSEAALQAIFKFSTHAKDTDISDDDLYIRTLERHALVMRDSVAGRMGDRESMWKQLPDRDKIPEGWSFGEPTDEKMKIDFCTVRNDISDQLEGHIKAGVDEQLVCEAAIHAALSWACFRTENIVHYNFCNWTKKAVDTYMFNAHRAFFVDGEYSDPNAKDD